MEVVPRLHWGKDCSAWQDLLLILHLFGGDAQAVLRKGLRWFVRPAAYSTSIWLWCPNRSKDGAAVLGEVCCSLPYLYLEAVPRQFWGRGCGAWRGSGCAGQWRVPPPPPGSRCRRPRILPNPSSMILLDKASVTLRSIVKHLFLLHNWTVIILPNKIWLAILKFKLRLWQKKIIHLLIFKFLDFTNYPETRYLIKPWFLQFCDFFMTFYLGRMM
jgi:hypothetical protein